MIHNRHDKGAFIVPKLLLVLLMSQYWIVLPAMALMQEKAQTEFVVECSVGLSVSECLDIAHGN